MLINNDNYFQMLENIKAQIDKTVNAEEYLCSLLDRSDFRE
jgi:hypothetical protein